MIDQSADQICTADNFNTAKCLSQVTPGNSLRYPIRKLQSLTFNYNQFFNFNLFTNDDLFEETNPRPQTPFCHAESVSLISLSVFGPGFYH